MNRLLRRVHLHLGVFFAPLLLFFVLTGWYQTVSPDRRKGVEDSNDWTSRLTRVHVEQYFPSDTAEGYSTRVFSTLVVVLSIALCLTVVLGVVLAFKVIRPPWMLWLSLALGFLVPILTLWLGPETVNEIVESILLWSALLALPAGVVLAVPCTSYRVGRHEVEVLVLGVVVRRVLFSNITDVRVGGRFPCEPWVSTDLFSGRLLTIRRKRALIRHLVITPRHPERLRENLCYALGWDPHKTR